MSHNSLLSVSLKQSITQFPEAGGWQGMIHPLNAMFFWPRCLRWCLVREFHCLIQIFLGCHVATGLAFPSPGRCSRQWHKAQGTSPAVLWLFHHSKTWHVPWSICQAFPRFIFQPPSSVLKRLYPLGLLYGCSCFIFMDNLRIHFSIPSPSLCCIFSLVSPGVMGPPS